MKVIKNIWAGNLILALFLGLFVNVDWHFQNVTVRAETLDTSGLVTNGTVYDTATYGTTTYIGGNFSYIGPNTGNGVPIKISTGNPIATYPKVNGTINTVTGDGLGGWYIGGSFTTVGGVSKSNLAHITAAGEVDTGFSPEPNLAVNSLYFSGSALYVGGAFSSIGGQSYSYLASVNKTTGVADAWDVQVDNVVYDMAMDSNTLYVAGSFSNIGGSFRSKVGAIDTLTATATSWNPFVDGTAVYSIAVDGTYAYFGGTFWSVSSTSVNNLASYSLAGTLSSWRPQPNSAVNDLELDGSTLYVGGGFSTIDGVTRNKIAAFDTGTGTATSWDPNITGGDSVAVNNIEISGSTVYAGGVFTTVGSSARNNVAGIDSSSGVATSFDAPAGGTVNGLAVSGDGVYLYVGGAFRSIGSGTAKKVGLAAVNNSTNSVLSFDANVSGNGSTVYALALSGDGATLYAGGSFSAIDGSSREDLAALDTATGTVVSAFNASIASSSYVYTLLLSGSTLYVGGNFNTFGVATRRGLAAVSTSNGGVTSFDPEVTGEFVSYVYDLALSGTTLYVGGNFSNVGTDERNGLAAIDTTTGLATSWNPTLTGMMYNTYVYALALQGTTLYIGGNFTGAGGASRADLAAIDTTTGLATSWAPEANGVVRDLAANASTVYAGGDFSTLGGASRAKVGAVSVSTGLATSWNPGADATVYMVKLATGHLFLGGDFVVFDGGSRFNLAHYTMPANSAPTVTISSATQKTDGSGTVDISALVDDADNDDTIKLKVEYKAGSDCSTSGSDPTFDETDANTTATYGDPKVENDEAYQVGNASGFVTTSSGANTVDFDWSAMTDLPSIDSATYCLRITPNDGTDAGTVATATLTVDNTVNVPGSVGLSAASTAQINMTWGDNSNPAGTEYYAENTTAGTNSGWVTDLSWNSTGLTCGTSYNFRVKARNTGGIETDFVSGTSTSTLSCPVAAPAGGPSVVIYSSTSNAETSDENSDESDEEETQSPEVEVPLNEEVQNDEGESPASEGQNAIGIVTGLVIDNVGKEELHDSFSDAKKIEKALSNVTDLILDKERVNYDILIEGEAVTDDTGDSVASEVADLTEEQRFELQDQAEVKDALEMLSEQKEVDFGKLSDAERVVEDKVDAQVRDKIYQLINSGAETESIKWQIGDKEVQVDKDTTFYVTFDKKKEQLMQEEVDKRGENKIVIGPSTVIGKGGVSALLLAMAGGDVADPLAGDKYFFEGFEGLGKVEVQYPDKPKFTNNLQGKTAGKGAVFWVGTPKKNTKLNLFAIDKVDPENKKSWKVYQLGDTTSDEGRKAVFNVNFEKDLSVDFSKGKKKMFFVVQDEKGKGSVVDLEIDFSKQVELNEVNLSNNLISFDDPAAIKIPMGEPLPDGIKDPMGVDASNLYTSVLLAQADAVKDRDLVMDGPANVKYLTGYAVPGSTVVVTWQSLTYNSVVIADASEGYFEVAVPDVLEAGNHEALVYVYKDSENLISNITSLLFGKGRS